MWAVLNQIWIQPGILDLILSGAEYFLSNFSYCVYFAVKMGSDENYQLLYSMVQEPELEPMIKWTGSATLIAALLLFIVCSST